MARKMLKRVKPAKKQEVIEGEFTVVKEASASPATPTLALPPAPPSDLMKRMDAAKARIRAKRPSPNSIVKATPPLAIDAVVGEAVVADKPIAEWAKVIEERTEKGGIVDLTDLPQWVSWAVDIWKRRGSPTEVSELVKKVTALRADAEELDNFASLDDNSALEESKSGNAKKAEKLLIQAKRKREKAEAKREEARKLSQEWEARKANNERVA